MAKKGFKAVALNDSFDEPRRNREEEEEENDDTNNESEATTTPSSTATNNNNNNTNNEFVTPMTTFHSTKTNTNSATNNIKTTFIGAGSNEKIVGSNESSPNSATRQSMESRDTISKIPQTPNTDLYFQRGEDFRHPHNRPISATSMDWLISRLDEESGSGVGETTSVRFNEFSDAFGGRLGARESAAATTNNAFVRACSKALDIPWCFGETRRTRKNVVATVVFLLLILFAAIPLRHWKHTSR